MKIGKNKKVLLILSFAMLVVFSHGQDWNLVWSDEFDGDTLDESLWSFQTGTGTSYGLPSGWGNNELQYYLEENLIVGDGLLTIIAKEESVGGKDYTSARIRTLNKGDWTYGRFEVRAKMPAGQGLWAALWMLPTDSEYGGWAASGEIDMVEFVGKDANKVYGTLHFGGQWPNNAQKGLAYQLSSGTFSDDFHVFAMDWNEGEIRWYVDDMIYQIQSRGDWYSEGYPFPAPFDKRFHFLINLAVGGNWPGSPDGSTVFPQELVIDYIRVYEKNTTATPGREMDQGYSLEQNIPNPFRPETVICYTTALQGHVTLEVYDSLGRLMQSLVDESQDPGSYQVNLDGSGLGPGHYTYRLKAGSYSAFRQMIIF